MCGICGIFNLDGKSVPGDGSLIKQMTSVLQHRGPDDTDTYHRGLIALGHRRLSIIDLSSAGRQPMSNEDGTVWIVYNGEVYNFAELKKSHRLVEKGHQFRSKTDTEVLVHLYEELGPQMVEELNGMFALAIWDARSHELHLLRDRYGIKPLFYTRQGDRLLFASEIKGLLQAVEVPRRVDLQTLHDYLTFNYVPGEQTMFEGIFSLPPAHQMTVRADGQTVINRYWDLSFEIDQSLDEQSAIARVRELIDNSVEQRLIADVPIGVLLSGGLDSSTITAIMHRHQTEPIRSYTVGFEDPSFDERPFARIVAKQYGTVHREIVITADLVRELLPTYLKSIDEPYADGSAIPTWYVCQLAKQDVGVVLSGEGGDEAFAGYETYAAYEVSRLFRTIPGWIRSGLIAPLIQWLPVSHKKLSLEFKMKRFLGGQDLSPAAAHLWWRIVLTEAEKLRLYTPQVLERLRFEPPQRHFDRVYDRSGATDVLNRLLHVDSTVFLPNDLMIKNDRMSMVHSLEARVPFCDHRLTEFLATVPARLKMPRLRKKHLLRKAMTGILPPAIINKKKVGLEMPYSRWLRNELNDLLQTFCGPDRIAETGYFRPESVQRLIDEHVAGRRDNGRALWGLLNFMIWLELYIP